MPSAVSHGYEEIAKEIKAIFSVTESTLHSLKKELIKDKFSTSYAFISKNIEYVVSFIYSELDKIISKNQNICDTWVSSPLMMSQIKGNPSIIFEYRDSIREFGDATRTIVSNLYANVGKTLAYYILVYETLEKFGLKPPFVLVESTEFSNHHLVDFIFGEFDKIAPAEPYKLTNAQVITYSGIDVYDPLSILIIGHEAFHIIERLNGLFNSFCNTTDFKGDMRCRDVFVDILSTFYFGPVYVYSMYKHFEKRYPISGESHMEMNIRLLGLIYLISVLGIAKISEEQIKEMIAFTKTLENRMDSEDRKNAQADKKKFEEMIDKGVIKYVENYFKDKNITPYSQFVNVIEKREINQSPDKINRDKIKIMIRKGIPVAVRPTTLLNTLYESKQIDQVETSLIIASFKKWYVKRYYEKSVEKTMAEKSIY